MKNPCILLREMCSINQKDFAAKYDFHKTTMVYWDAGMYPEVSDRMNLALAKECRVKGIDATGELLVAYGVETLNEAYELWQRATRIAQSGTIKKTRIRPRKDSDKSPFYWLMMDSCGSLQSFCKTLLVPAASALRYGNGSTYTMPEVIEIALENIEYPHIETLKAKQVIWMKEQ